MNLLPLWMVTMPTSVSPGSEVDIQVDTSTTFHLVNTSLAIELGGSLLSFGH